MENPFLGPPPSPEEETVNPFEGPPPVGTSASDSEPKGAVPPSGKAPFEEAVDPFVGPPPEERPTSFLGDVWSGIARGKNSLDIMASMWPAAAGLSVSNARIVQMMKDQKERETYGFTPETEEQRANLARLAQATTWNVGEGENVLSALINNWRGTASIAAESLLPSVPAAVAGLGASAVGTPAAGAAVAFGVGSGLTQAAGSVEETLGSLGIDTNDPRAVRRALDDPTISATIRKNALLSGAATGAIDTVTMGMQLGRLPQRLARGVIRGETKIAKAGRAALEVGTGMGIEAGGEGIGTALSEYATKGEVNLLDVGTAVAGELLLGGAMDLATAGGMRALERGSPVSEAEAAELIESQMRGADRASDTVVSASRGEAVRPSEAATVGKKFYGMIDETDPNAPRLVSADPQEAERLYGERPGVRRMYAVGENEVTATEGDFDLQAATRRGRAAIVEQARATGTPQGEELARILEEPRIIPSRARDAYGAFREVGGRIIPIQNGEAILEAQPLPVVPEMPNIVEYSNGVLVNQFDQTMEGRNAPSFTWQDDVQGTSMAIDLDRLKAAVEKRGGVVAPTNWGEIVHMKRSVPQAFENTFEQTRTFDASKVREAFADGRIRWRGRLDPRMLQKGFSLVGIDPEEVESVIAESRSDQVGPQRVQSAFQRGPKLGRFGHGYGSDVESITAVLNRLAAEGMTETLVTGDNTPFTQGVGNALKRLQRKMAPGRKLLVVFDGPAIESPELRMHVPGLADIIANQAEAKNLGEFGKFGKEWSIIRLDPDSSNMLLWSTAAHEFGHFLSANALWEASIETYTKLYGAYRRSVEATKPGQTMSKRLLARRRFALPYLQAFGEADMAEKAVSSPEYFLSFEEWFAEQVARYATTNQALIGEVSRFIKNLADRLMMMFRNMAKASGLIRMEDYRAEVEMENWLDALLSGRERVQWADSLQKRNDTISTIQNARASDSPEDAGPLQSRTVGTKKVLEGLTEGEVAAKAREVTAQLSRLWPTWRSSLSHVMVAKRLPGFRPIQLYREYREMMKLTSNRLMVEMDGILRTTKALGAEMGDRLGAMMIELAEQTYLTPEERKAKVRRQPTEEELRDLVVKHRLSKEAVESYFDLRRYTEDSIRRIEEVRIEWIKRASMENPRMAAEAAVEVSKVQDETARMLQTPYFPMMNFGQFVVRVIAPKGKTVHMEAFDYKGDQSRAYQALRGQYPESQGFRVVADKAPENAVQFFGLTKWELERMKELPDLTEEQVRWIEESEWLRAPGIPTTMARRVRDGSIQGFSGDLRRVFASFAMKHSRFYARTKFQADIQAQIREVGQLAKLLPGVNNKLRDLQSFMRESYEYSLEGEKNHITFLRSLNAVWHLGFAPVAAFVNLTQPFTTTMPFLADKFGPGNAMKAILKAQGDWTTYYKKGSLGGMTEPFARALGEAIKRNKIDESMAAELVGLATNGGLRVSKRWIGRSLEAVGVTPSYQWFTEKAMKMFSLAEQMVRRQAFKATWDLAMKNPDNKWVTDLEVSNPLLMQEMVDLGMPQNEARAFVAAVTAVDDTMFVYDRENRPKFLRGWGGVAFAFYSFTHNTIFMLGNNPKTAIYWALVMMTMAGLQGLVPDDVEDILDAIAKRAGYGPGFFERESRKLVNGMLDGTGIPPDIMLNGVGRYGLGIPALMQTAGMSWFPDVDLSANLAMNRVLPGGELTGPVLGDADWERRVTKSVEAAAGPTIGIGYNLWKALEGSELDWADWKRWENAMPRTIRNVGKAWDAAVYGGLRSRTGAIVEEVDPQRPEDIAETIAQGLGFRPTKWSQGQDLANMANEVSVYLRAKRASLLDQAYFDLHIYKDKEGYADTLRSIREFNEDVREYKDRELLISPDTIRRSMKARLQRKGEVERPGSLPGSPGVGQTLAKEYPEVVEERRVR